MIRRATNALGISYLLAEWFVGKVRWWAWSAEVEEYPEVGIAGLYFVCKRANAPASVMDAIRDRAAPFKGLVFLR